MGCLTLYYRTRDDNGLLGRPMYGKRGETQRPREVAYIGLPRATRAYHNTPEGRLTRPIATSIYLLNRINIAAALETLFRRYRPWRSCVAVGARSFHFHPHDYQRPHIPRLHPPI
jgi:hypothetical protein